MDDTTQVEMAHMSGEDPQTFVKSVEAGTRIIEGGAEVKRLFVLKEGAVMVSPASGVKASPNQTEYIGMAGSWSTLGARPFFAAKASSLVYTALTDCTGFWYDSRMFQTERDGKGLSRGSLLGIARSLVLNSDISEIFVPKVAAALGYDVPKRPNLHELQAAIGLITRPDHREAFQKFAFTTLVKLLRKHELVMKGDASIVGSAALAAEGRRPKSATPPPTPHSLARRAWEASRSA